MAASHKKILDEFMTSYRPCTMQEADHFFSSDQIAENLNAHHGSLLEPSEVANTLQANGYETYTDGQGCVLWVLARWTTVLLP
ncbi:hypothetical protein SAMN05421780_108189 [Flexibacter flexilis DSM 6793]|uniref:Uncharacterized protein n=2 Tax=Flexibacter flexilis TaxID=998 RepID=A0A1I1LE25_9BACT|nr:hypothetical protein SAMN05421780_108189 [Flexibacter flexilis DSM 6793]